MAIQSEFCPSLFLFLISLSLYIYLSLSLSLSLSFFLSLSQYVYIYIYIERDFSIFSLPPSLPLSQYLSLYINISISISLYLYIYGSNHTGRADFGLKSQNLIVKNGHETPAPERCFFFMLWFLLFFLSAIVFLISLSSFPFSDLKMFGFVVGVVLVCFSFFPWGFKGQVRWPKRATSLGPKPSFFVLLVFLCWFAFSFRLDGLRGQVRWPKGPLHLALNHS